MKTGASKNINRMIEKEIYNCKNPQETFDLGEKIGEALKGGEVILLSGGLGAGKTLFTKGVLYALDYDVDEVNSPSFTLVNLYETTSFNVFHIDLWRLDARSSDAAFAVGLDEILEDEKSVVIIEWRERLGNYEFSRENIFVNIAGDGDDERRITISRENI